jgi:hypothetical protein
MYFKYFDTFSYLLNNKNYDFVDIFKRISFSIKTKENKSIFTDYYVVDGDSAENIANKFYGDPGLGWFVLLCNNFTRRDEFPLSIEQIEKNARARYPGSSFYFLEYIPELKAGDILIKCTVSGGDITSYDTTKYAIVQEYNNVIRYAIVNENVGLQNNDYVAIKRLVNEKTVDVFYDVLLEEDVLAESRNFVQIKKITEAIQSPIEFLNANSNYISPYYINTQYEAKSNAIGIYSTANIADLNTVANTTLYSFVNNTASVSTRTIFQKYIEANNKNRILKLVKPVYAGEVFSAMQELLLDDEIRIKNIEVGG